MRNLSLLLVLLLSFVIAQERKSHPLQREEVMRGIDFEEVKRLLKTAFERRNMDVLELVDVSKEGRRFSYMLLRSPSYMGNVLGEFPQLGVLFPWRVYLYEREDGSVVVGCVNVDTLLRLFGKDLSEEAKGLLRKMNEEIRSGIMEVRR